MSTSRIQNTNLKHQMTPTSFVDMLKNCPHQKLYMEDIWNLHKYPDYPSGVGTSNYFKIVVIGSGSVRFARVVLFCPTKVYVGQLNATEDAVEWAGYSPS